MAVLIEPLLTVRRVLREQITVLHRRLLAIVRDDDVCRRLMTVPGVGAVVALTFRVTVDVPTSLIALEPASTLIAVIEMSLSSWLVAGIVPGIERQPLKKLAVDESALLRL